MGAVHRIMAACHGESNLREPYRSLADAEAYLRHPPAVEPRWYWLAEHGGEPVGFAQLALANGSPVGRVEILVHPTARRQGVGRALLAAVVAGARQRACTALVGSHATGAGAEFAVAAGAVDGRVDVRSLLALARYEPTAWLVDGYRLCGWVGVAPESLVASYARAREAINDAPTAIDGERVSWDAAFVRDLERVLERRGREVRVTVVLDANSNVAGFTEVRVSRHSGATATTEDTAVLRAHRGKGLARWLKNESLTGLRADRPDVPYVATTNAEGNVAMLGLNTKLGFVPVARHTTCAIQL